LAAAVAASVTISPSAHGIDFPARGTARGRARGARDACRLEDVTMIGAARIERIAWIDN
jgi:hypothetical protein